MAALNSKYSSILQLINTSVLVNSEYLLERESVSYAEKSNLQPLTSNIKHSIPIDGNCFYSSRFGLCQFGIFRKGLQGLFYAFRKFRKHCQALFHAFRKFRKHRQALFHAVGKLRQHHQALCAHFGKFRQRKKGLEALFGEFRR